VKTIYLRTAREQKGWTQEQLEAETARLGAKVPQAIISKLENQPQARALFTTVVSLADALGLEPRSLRFGPDPNRSRNEGQAVA
jgi:hypothetical protein